MGEFRMPSLGADMDAGTLVEWQVKPGAAVKRGDIMALVETQKGIVEVEVWEDGVVDTLVVAPGTEVPVGTVLATLRGTTPQAPPPPRAEAIDVKQETGVLRASPAARQLARELGIDIASVHGTGSHGAITRGDVESAHAPPPSETRTARPSPPKPDDGQAMRRAIAAAMAKSKREIPHYYLSTDVDATRAIRWLEAENAKRSVEERVLFAALLVKATALAAAKFPSMNGFYTDNEHKPSDAVHVGVAVSMRQGGLIAPAVHDADKKALAELMTDLRDVVGRVRHGHLRASELSDPTITMTSLGDTGVASVFGVIYPPQVAIVGFGRPLERPWAENGMLGVRTVMTVTLAADHRASDGHTGALFLEHLTRLLGAPENL